ncbi:MAG: hypothetical protein Q7R40_19340 [Phaeospirillum sp.]|nr:hypothetical protein [Phaeospirillum sp.]
MLVSRILLLTALLVGGPVMALADGAAEMERGVAMARQGQWPLALRYFRAAHAEMPGDAAVMLNLGLVHDRMGGHEAEAIAWFRAYLAAAPGAANVNKVKGRIAEMDAALDVRIQQLLDVARRILGELSSPKEKTAVLSAMMRAYAEAGDISTAQALERQAPSGGGKPDWGIAAVAAAQARRGNFSGARAEAERPGAEAVRSWAMAEIAVAQAQRDDFAAAAITTEAIANQNEASYMRSRVAVLMARRGNIGEAMALADRIDGESNPAAKALVLAAISTALVRAGDAGKGAEALAEAEKNLPRAPAGANRSLAQAMTIVARSVSFPETSEAAALAELEDPSSRARFLRDLAAARGDVALAAVFRWVVVAHDISGGDSSDIPRLMEVARTETPVKSGITVAAAAAVAAQALARVRE